MNISSKPIYNGTSRSYLIAYYRNGRHAFGIRAPRSFVVWYSNNRQQAFMMAIGMCVAVLAFIAGQTLLP